MAEYLASIFGTEKDKVNCSFYFKIGACRHGDRCSRIHNKPTFSQTCLLQNLYVNPQNSAKSADGSHLVANVSDEEMQEHYDNFFEDVFVECEDKYGEIEEMNVCDNLGDHLVGNVYIKFRREEDAESAVNDLNDRWFGGRPVYAELSPVTDFREACCRQYEMGECTRSGFCNFMHLKPISRELRRSPMENTKRTQLTTPKSNISRYPKLEKAIETPKVLIETESSNEDSHSSLRKENHVKLFPCYTSVLARTIEEGISVEDLDQLQHELETLFSYTAKRNRFLKDPADVGNIYAADNKRRLIEKPSPATVKRMKVEDKFKFRSKNPGKRLMQGKYNISLSLLEKNMVADSAMRLPRVFKPRNDLSEKFWNSVEPYCQDIKRDHINYLDTLIRVCSTPENLQTPTAGLHCASNWSASLLPSEKQAKEIHKLNIQRSATEFAHFDNLQQSNATESSITQRLLESLGQVNVLKDIPLSSSKVKDNFRNTHVGLCQDHRLHTELIPVDANNSVKTKPADNKDEILKEIERCYKEMNNLNQYNVRELEKLRAVCTQEFKQQSVRTILNQVDPRAKAIRVRCITR